VANILRFMKSWPAVLYVAYLSAVYPAQRHTRY